MSEQLTVSDESWMSIALHEAQQAYEQGEVPIGAVVVKGNNEIARAHNLRETWQDATAHAELIAIRRASTRLGGWRLHECTIYVTVEPCPMCAGAIVQSRLNRVVFGALDPKAWGNLTIEQLLNNPELNHRVTVVEGCLKSESAQLIKDFFRRLRE